MTKKILSILFLFTILPVAAANWSQIFPKTWYDTNSLTRKGNIVRVWIKDLNPGDWDNVNNKKVWYYMREVEADCANRKLRLVNNIAFDLKGNSIYNFTNPEIKRQYDYGESKFYSDEIWEPSVPGTASENIYNFMCSQN